MVWYSHLFQNFPQFVIHTVKGFGRVYKAERDVFLKLYNVSKKMETDIAKLGVIDKIVYIYVACDFLRYTR